MRRSRDILKQIRQPQDESGSRKGRPEVPGRLPAWFRFAEAKLGCIRCMIVCVWLLLLTGTAEGVRAQQNDLRLQEVREVYQKFLYAGLNSKGTGSCRMEMVTTYCHRDSAHVPKAVSKVVMATEPGKFSMTSDQIVVYRDDRNTATILPLKKVIYYGESIPLEKRNKDEQQAKAELIDSLLGYCKIKTYRESMSAKGVPMAAAELVPGPLAVKASGVTRVVIEYDAACKELKQVRTDYAPGNEMAYSIVRYESLAANPDEPVLAGSVKKIVFNGNRLSAKYAGFELIDLRITDPE